MRLQALGVVFAIIIVPLMLVLSYYLNLQVKTIARQNEYDNDLLAATYDAMSSFEINTANEDLSTVSDSLRTIIEASCNVFINTLSTNLGVSNASKAYVEPYIPALLYTLYDGYYIYSDTQVPEMFTDVDTGVAISIGDQGLTYDTNGYHYDPDGTGIIKYSDFTDAIGTTHKDYYGQQLYKAKDTSGKPLEYIGNPSENTRVTPKVEEATIKEKKVLKSYMPYSAKYVQHDGSNDINITVIYTLDNFVTIEGYINNIYYTKSGYLIPNKDIISIDTVSNNLDDSNKDAFTSTGSYLKNYNQSDARDIIKAGTRIRLKIGSDTIITSGDYDVENIVDSSGATTGEKKSVPYLVKEGTERYDYTKLEQRIKRLKEFCDELESYTKNEDIENFLKNHYTEASLPETYATNLKESKDKYLTIINRRISDYQYELDKASAICYYTEAYIFTEWVENNLSTLKESSLIEISGQEYTSVNGVEDILYDFSSRDTTVFDFTGVDTDNYKLEIAKSSVFYTHKINVIRNSIQYNLNVAMSTYNKTNAVNLYDYRMPILNSAEWEKILSNASIVSFMQGYSCGLKTYNNYKIVTSTNNELTVDPNELYYVPKDLFNNKTSAYHKIDCKDFVDETASVSEFIAFPSKEVKYDKIYNKTDKLYHYDHRNLACYDCVNDRNYDKVDIFKLSGDGSGTYENSSYKNLRTAYYIGVGKERNNIYKMNAFLNSLGRQTIYFNGTPEIPTMIDNTTVTDKGLKYVKEIRITHDTMGDNDLTVVYDAKCKDNTLCTNNTIAGNKSTFVITIDPDKITNNPDTVFKLGDLIFMNKRECKVYINGAQTTWTAASPGRYRC